MTQVTAKLIRLHAGDNVALAAESLARGSRLDDKNLTCTADVPAGHKVALTPIAKGEAVHKYGTLIGHALTDIEPGDHVHSHNLAMSDHSQEYRVGVDAKPTSVLPPEQRAVFQGYVRGNGKVGTRNYIGVLSTVNCSASVSHFIADQAETLLKDQLDNIDGIVGVSHGAGCCMTIGGEGLEILQDSLAGFARNPNFCAVLVVGLGCEVNLVSTFMESSGLATGPLLATLDIQELGGTAKTVAAGVEKIKEMLPRLSHIKRETVSAEHLMVALECGGSDAYSGISSNPALGAAADLVVQHGGTVILAETPEIYGAEHLLIQRAESQEVADKLIDRIKWWEGYTEKHGAQINNNPTPGNKEGGLTTILEKSLGAVAKAGTTNLKDVFRYAKPVTTRGMVFMDTPGYDIASITGMIAGGANMVCFTTGRGTVVGFKPVPTLKLSSNTAMYQRMSDDIDINCGPVVDQGVGIREMGDTIFQAILDTASGTLSKSEAYGFGDNEFVPWHIGAVL